MPTSVMPDFYPPLPHDHGFTASAVGANSTPFGVLHNDTGNGPIAVVAVNGNANAVGQPITLPSGAALTLFADGGFSYAAAPGVVYLENFSYSASDGVDTASTFVTFPVTNAAPVPMPTT